jgi:tetratricopeptide (TPR) repeat protein
MKMPVKHLRPWIIAAIMLTAWDGAEGQTTVDASTAWQGCAASPTASCLGELALSQMPMSIRSDATYLIQAGLTSQAMERWRAAGKHDHSDESNLQMSELVRRVRTALVEARRDGRTAEELKAQLATIDAALPPGLERHGQPLMRTDVYLDTAKLMTEGVGATVHPAEGSGFGWPERAALRRHLAQRYGASLEVFIARAQEIAAEERAWMNFARAMATLGRMEEAQWATRQMNFNVQPQRGSGDCYVRAVALLLEIGDFREADRVLGAANCYAQKAEIARRYAENGETARARQIAYEVLDGLPAYMKHLTNMLDGPSLGDTVEPLLIALALAGDHERILKEIQELERFVRHEGRNLVSFAGASLSIHHLAQIYYEIGEGAKADALIEASIAETGSRRHPSWSKPLAIAHAKCMNGKPNCLDALLNLPGETLDRETGERILSWAMRAGRHDITAEVIGQKFNIADAWLLNYGKLSLEVLAGDEDGAAQTLRLLIDKENHSSDEKPLLRCLFLLRLAVAMEKQELARDVAKIILSRVFGRTSAEIPPARDHVDWERQPANRASMLAESAGVFAQLP